MAVVDNLNPRDYIIIKGAKANNLKNIDVAIPRNKFIVITGLSGSGKSSLAFDTLYAEGQRRYVESLSSYARQFLGRMHKPEVDYIKGISPAIAIEQKVNTRNPRSTVGTSTEIYEYIKLLFASIGETISPVSGNKVVKHSVTDVVNHIENLPKGSRINILAPLKVKSDRSIQEQLNILVQQGFTRIEINEQTYRIQDIPQEITDKKCKKVINVVVDRIIIDNTIDEDTHNRIGDSVQTALYEGHGECKIEITDNEGTKTRKTFSDKFELDGISFEEPDVNLFTFNNPFGACKKCEGFGTIIGIDEDLVIPNKTLSVFENAVACWRGEKMSEWKNMLIAKAYKFNFPVHKPYRELSEEQKRILWEGNEYFEGINRFFQYVEEQSYKIQYRIMYAKYRGKTLCDECKGGRLRKEASYIYVGGKNITELVNMSAHNLLDFFLSLKLNESKKIISKRLLKEITTRLNVLINVGLGYLTLNRNASSLSGGESQRINLATSIGSGLVDSMYILDEPSIGLHPRDTEKLISVLKALQYLGNTVIVVEHDESIIKAADEIIDIGLMAGINGGNVIFQGNYQDILNHETSLTGKYLSKKLSIEIPKYRAPWRNYIELQGVRENNLKGFNIRFPLEIITVVTGVSGSGKSSLVKGILYPAIRKIFGESSDKTGKYDLLIGDIKRIKSIEFIDQNPIGRSSRSNPVTYIKAFDEIRQLFANQPLAKLRGFKPGYFSFNVAGGRCDECDGDGQIKIEMQFMADVYLVCESCHGKRFKEEVLEIKFRNKNIAEILEMNIDEAIEFFSNDSKEGSIEAKIVEKLKPMSDVGLGYLTLGQSSSTLSGGEAQRIKLASFLVKGNDSGKILFIFDEPTMGLHFHDIHKLLYAFRRLISNGHSIIIIEHNPEIIKSADWVIDLGPEGGDQGGNLVFQGTPENLIKCKESYTGKYLKEVMENDK
ncbi:MAG: excinuclease ABC subunit UvrA [Bacteroidota bacterium]|nr:excinuclease ABC subunit UvrA [Bacteroidota bacterium]